MEFRAILVSDDSRLNRDASTIFAKELDHLQGDKLSLKIFSSPPSLEETIQYAPNLIIVAMESSTKGEKTTYLEQISRIADRIPVVVCSSNLTADLMLYGVKKGVRDFIRFPFDPSEISEMLQRMARQVPRGGMEMQRSGVTYVFFSYKGGLGTTFLACNTAVAIARLTRMRVLLWDLVIQNGDVPFFFDYEPSSTVSDLLENQENIDETYLRATLPLHQTGISILAGPKRPEEAEVIRNDQLQALHQTLVRHYDYLVIDGGHALTDQIISAMDHSKYILLITDLHLPVLKNTLRCLEIFERLGYNQEKIKILLNRYNSKYQKFDLDKAEEILRHPISYTMANDYMMVSRSLNTGIPVAELDENSLLARQFNGLARLLLGEFRGEEPRSFSLLSPLKALFGGRHKTGKGGARKKKAKRADASPEGEKVKEENHVHAA